MSDNIIIREYKTMDFISVEHGTKLVSIRVFIGNDMKAALNMTPEAARSLAYSLKVAADRVDAGGEDNHG